MLICDSHQKCENYLDRSKGEDEYCVNVSTSIAHLQPLDKLFTGLLKIFYSEDKRCILRSQGHSARHFDVTEISEKLVLGHRLEKHMSKDWETQETFSLTSRCFRDRILCCFSISIINSNPDKSVDWKFGLIFDRNIRRWKPRATSIVRNFGRILHC